MDTSTYVILPGGVHLWDPKPAGLGDLPSELIESRSAGHALKELEPPGWRELQGDVVVVRGDIPEVGLRGIAVTAEELERMLYRELGDAPERNAPYKVRVFNSQMDFCRFAAQCGAANALSLYDPRSMEMVLHFGPEVDSTAFETTFAHEFTHAWMDRVYRVHSPLWFAEGMAEYFSHVKWTPEGYRLVQEDLVRLKNLNNSARLPLKALIELPRDAMYGILFPVYYAQAWSVFAFLMDKHRDIAMDMLNQRHVDLTPLDKEYERYVKRLVKGL